MILKAALLLAFMGFLISFGLCFQSIGRDQGALIHEQLMDEHRVANGEETVSFSVSGPRTYEYLRSHYGLIALFFGAFFVAKMSESTSFYKELSGKVISQVTCFSSLILVSLNLRTLLVDKSLVDEYFWAAPMNNFARLTITYDWLLVTTVFILAGLQVVSLVQILKRPK